MKLVFDPDKDAANLAKHGISLLHAADLDLATAVVLPVDRRDYGEPRWRAYGMISGRLHMMAFTVRNDAVRVISLRKANAREIRSYG